MCAAVCACADSSGPQSAAGEIAIRTDRTEYEPNQLIIVRTTNRSGRLVYDDHCGGEVQGFEFLKKWNASYGAARGCFNFDPGEWQRRSIAIPNGSVHVDTFHVNGRAYTGTWRVQLYFRDEVGELLPENQSVSNAFRVNGTWSPEPFKARQVTRERRGEPTSDAKTVCAARRLRRGLP